MNKGNLQYEIQHEQMARAIAALEGIFVSVFAVVTALLLPQLIFQVLLTQGNIQVAQSQFLNYIPTISYVVAAFFFLLAMIGNYLRARKVKNLKLDLELLSFSVSDMGNDGDILAEALAQAEKELAAASKSAAKSSEKKTSTRKSTKSSSKASKKSTSAKKSKKKTTK